MLIKLCLRSAFVTAQLLVTLLDVNDNDPEFEYGVYNVNVSENALNNQQLLTVEATDTDEDSVITYKIINGSEPTNSFSIDKHSGKNNIARLMSHRYLVLVKAL